jgi:hypothetical protein
MALDHLILKVREHFFIETLEDWQKVRPEHVLQIHGCGQATLDHLRIYLAAHGLTLRDDQTPNYWNQHLAAVRIGATLTDEQTAIIEPFTILIDSQEKHPFTFQGFIQEGRPLIVPTRFQSLGPTHGDYSAIGLEFDCHIERKSREDAQATFLAHGERRERWLRTLGFLAEILCGAIVIECSMGEMLQTVEPHGKRSKATLQKTLHRQVLAWQIDYGLPFIFCDNRKLAQATAFQLLRRRWHVVNGLKKERTPERESVPIANL